MVRCLAGKASHLVFRVFRANDSRSLYTYKMPNKPITQGYKIYGIADHGYL
jgi:hypothetical protein